MKNILCILLMALPFLGMSQPFTPLREPVPPTANLLQVGDHIVLIQPMDAKNQLHKWLSFDSSLRIVGAKKLVSPDWEGIVSQSYFATHDAVIRIDQLIFNDSLYLSLFRFDALGNPQQKIELARLPATGKKLEPLTFYVCFSSDKKILALVQPLSEQKDQLTLSAIVLSDQLNLLSSMQRSFAFDMLVMDMLPPLVDTAGSVFVPVVDKFESYRLSTAMQLLPLAGNDEPQQWRFERKKLKDVRLKLKNNQLSVSALYSLEESKTDIAGAMNATLPLGQKIFDVSYHGYDDALKKSLSKKIGTIGRKGNLLNYLYLFPSRQPQSERAYGVLLMESIPGRLQNTPTVANASADMDKLRRQLATVNSLVGTARRRSQTQPISTLTYAEASTQAAIMERTRGNLDRNNETETVSTVSALPEPKKDNSQQLLYFSHKDSIVRYQFLKLRLPTEPFYEFFTYVEVDGRYHAIHYQLPSLTKPQLVSTTIGDDGKLVQKVLLENRYKLLIGGYPTLVYNGKKLIAVYEDRQTGVMGIVNVGIE